MERPKIKFIDYGLPDRLWAFPEGSLFCVATAHLSKKYASRYVAFYISDYGPQGVFQRDNFDSLEKVKAWLKLLDGEFR